jgi:hypothetical protein
LRLARSRLGVIVLAAAALVLATACRSEVATPASDGPSFEAIPRVQAGAPRSFHLGFSALPARLSDEAYAQALDLAANYGEVVLLQRPPEWESFLPGESVSSDLERTTLAERRALTERGLQVMFAIDVFDPASRDRLAGLPAEYEGENLSNPELRRAFVRQARFVALNYRPDYLVLGVEVNGAFELDPEGYEAFVEAYAEAYAEVKSASPTTQVFPTFQYEQLLGLVPWEPPHAPRWRLLEDYAGRMDALAITSYPSFVYQVSRKLPANYYTQLAEQTTAPIIFASTGFASTASREGLNSATEDEQRKYLGRLLSDAETLRSPVVIWFAGRDPEFAQAPPLDLVASIGLRASDDRQKDAWAVWEEAVNRPYDASATPAPAPAP